MEVACFLFLPRVFVERSPQEKVQWPLVGAGMGEERRMWSFIFGSAALTFLVQGRWW